MLTSRLLFIAGCMLACIAQHTMAAPSAPAPVNAAYQSSPTLSRILKTGVVKVGYIPTPGTFAFKNDAGETVGYSIDICQRVIDNIRKQLNRNDLKVEFRPVQASERIPHLKSGTIDMECGGNTNTMKRQRDVDFSYTFFNTGVRFLVRKPTDFDGPPTVLWKKKIAVTKGTTAEEIVNRLRIEREVVPVLVDNDNDGVRMVEIGSVDGFAQDDVLLYGLQAGSKQKDQLAITGAFMTVEPYAFMLPKDDIQLRDIVDRTMLGLMQSGEIKTLYRKWFDTERMRIPLNVYMRENFRFPSRYGIP